MRLDEAGCRPDFRAAPAPADRRAAFVRSGRLALVLLDLAVGLGRKVGGFVALLTLGWTYLRLLVIGQSLHQLYPRAPDPDLRQALWTVLLLVLAQGWDIPTDRLAADWGRLREALPSSATGRSPFRLPAITRSAVGAVRAPAALVIAPAAPVVVRLGRFMDLCVAIANKVGALAALVALGLLAWRMTVEGMDARRLYPQARDPAASLLADLSVGAVVVGWWGMPMEQIVVFWRRLRGVDEPAG